MQGLDIRPLKQRMRKEIKEWRRSLDIETKAAYDRKILEKLLALREYETCEAVLTYVSLPIEVGTMELIAQSLAKGKRVAVPRCVENTRKMEFYLIDSFEQLEPGAFGVLEPIKEKCRLFEDWNNSICIVPALAYDKRGFRLGYGAGYYDRFLSGYPGMKIGIVYAENLKRRLHSGRFDVPVDLIVTEKRLWTPRSVRKKR